MVSYLEWLRWVDTGRIRCSGRTARIRDAHVSEDFANLMDLAPDISRPLDDAYVLAKLKQGFNQSCEIAKTKSKPMSLANLFRLVKRWLNATLLSEPTWLGLEAVEKFLPVSERGARLIKSDAEKAWVLLGDPEYESAWELWVKEHNNQSANKRGHMLVKAMNLPSPEISNIHEKIHHYFTSDQKPSIRNADKISATQAMGWCYAFATFRELVGEEKAKEVDKEYGISDELKRLSQLYDIHTPISEDEKMVSVVSEIDSTFKDALGSIFNIRLLATVFHYQEVLSSGKEVNLISLVQDIKEIAATNGGKSTAVVVYYIGWHMKDTEVTKLYYASKPDDFPSLSPENTPCQINISETDKQTNESS